MNGFHMWLSGFAAYFGIIAAILALGSWLATNYFGTRANSAKNALNEAKSAFETSSRFRRIYGLVNEETQNLDHVYDLLRDFVARSDHGLATSDKHRRESERYDWLKRLEYARHADRAVQDEVERAGQLLEYSATLHVGEDVNRRARSVYDDICAVAEQRRAAREKLEASIQAVGNVYELDDSGWSHLVEEMTRYRETVEISLIPAQNAASRKVASLESEIVGLHTQQAADRKRVASVVQRIALALYVASALLALYGKGLEARYPRRSGQAGVTISAPSRSRGATASTPALRPGGSSPASTPQAP